MGKLDRLKKEATQNEAGAGMGDAVAKTENIRNWVSLNSTGVQKDTPKFNNNN